MTKDYKKLLTSCESCVFARMNDNIQIDCDIGRLEIFKKYNQAEFDEQNGCFNIKRVCNTCRSQKWANKQFGNNLIAKVEKEISLSLDFILLSVDDTIKDIVERLSELVKSCVLQKVIKPKNIIVIVKNCDISYQKIYDTLNEIVSEYDIKFQLVRVLEKDADIYRCLNIGVRKSKTSRFFASFIINDKIPLNFIAVLNTYINYDLKRFTMLRPFSKISGLAMSPYLYNVLGKIDIVDKVTALAKEQENENQIITWNQLWNHE